ncbi:MAG TPA: hypothetical protein VK137_07630 [Planctomycetaceae bacterium]|nr:hypothetical protein [Planctomycetaceae bacterium]
MTFIIRLRPIHCELRTKSNDSGDISRRCSTRQRLHRRRVHRRVSRLGFGACRLLLGFLEASHFFSEVGLSPDRLPSSKPATVKSSSRSGQ